MNTIFKILSNEDIISTNAIDVQSDYFIIKHLLRYIETSELDFKYFLFYLENDILSLFNRIKERTEMISYIKDFEKILNKPISMEDIPSIKKILESIYNTHYKDKENEIVIKLLD